MNSGLVTALQAGTVDITATYQNVNGSVRLTVPQPVVLIYTLSGTVTDGTSGGILPGIRMSITTGTNAGLSTTTDSTGKFSFSNLRPGQHAFRVDPRSIPEGYRLASDDARLVEASGWTTPRVDFRVIPTGTSRVDAVTAHRSVTLNFTALPQGSQVRYEVTLRAPQDFAFDALACATHRSRWS